MMNRTIEKSVNAGLGYPFMKKILLLVAAVGCGAFFGCEKDVSSKDSKLDYIQIRVTSDDEQEPSGNVYLFYISSSKTEINGTPRIAYWYPVDVPY